MNTTKQLYLLLIIGLSGWISCSSSKTDWHMYELQGKVASFSLTNYEARLTETDQWEREETPNFSGTMKHFFDEEGRCMSMELYVDGELTGVTQPQYEHGNLVGWLNVDERGHKTGESRIVEESSRIREIEAYNKEGEIQMRSEQELNKGRKVSEKSTYFRPDHEADFVVESAYTYNWDGTMHSSQQRVDGEESLSFELIYLAYDDQGNWIQKVAVDQSDNPDTRGVGLLTIREIVYY